VFIEDSEDYSQPGTIVLIFGLATSYAKNKNTLINFVFIHFDLLIFGKKHLVTGN
jgi:hypothetical protein